MRVSEIPNENHVDTLHFGRLEEETHSNPAKPTILETWHTQISKSYNIKTWDPGQLQSLDPGQNVDVNGSKFKVPAKHPAIGGQLMNGTYI